MNYHPTISHEMNLLHKAEAAIDVAISGLQDGSVEIKNAQVLVNGGKVYNAISAQSIKNRQAAPKLAMSEAKLIDNQKSAPEIENKKKAA